MEMEINKIDDIASSEFILNLLRINKNKHPEKIVNNGSIII